MENSSGRYAAAAAAPPAPPPAPRPRAVPWHPPPRPPPPSPGHPQPPGHPLAQSLNPSRQLAYRGSQPSSFLALSFDDPRAVVIQATMNSPASGRASHAGTRSGGRAPATRARYGSHPATGAGSLSTMLYTPGAPPP